MRKYTRCKDMFFFPTRHSNPICLSDVVNSESQLCETGTVAVWDLALWFQSRPCQFHPNVARKKLVTSGDSLSSERRKMTSAKTDCHGFLLIACDLHAAEAFCENMWCIHVLQMSCFFIGESMVCFPLSTARSGRAFAKLGWPAASYLTRGHWSFGMLRRVLFRRFIRFGQLSFVVFLGVCRASSWKCKMFFCDRCISQS